MSLLESLNNESIHDELKQKSQISNGLVLNPNSSLRESRSSYKLNKNSQSLQINNEKYQNSINSNNGNEDEGLVLGNQTNPMDQTDPFGGIPNDSGISDQSVSNRGALVLKQSKQKQQQQFALDSKLSSKVQNKSQKSQLMDKNSNDIKITVHGKSSFIDNDTSNYSQKDKLQKQQKNNDSLLQQKGNQKNCNLNQSSRQSDSYNLNLKGQSQVSKKQSNNSKQSIEIQNNSVEKKDQSKLSQQNQSHVSNNLIQNASNLEHQDLFNLNQNSSVNNQSKGKIQSKQSMIKNQNSKNNSINVDTNLNIKDISRNSGLVLSNSKNQDLSNNSYQEGIQNKSDLSQPISEVQSIEKQTSVKKKSQIKNIDKDSFFANQNEFAQIKHNSNLQKDNSQFQKQQKSQIHRQKNSSLRFENKPTLLKCEQLNDQSPNQMGIFLQEPSQMQSTEKHQPVQNKKSIINSQKNITDSSKSSIKNNISSLKQQKSEILPKEQQIKLQSSLKQHSNLKQNSSLNVSQKEQTQHQINNFSNLKEQNSNSSIKISKKSSIKTSQKINDKQQQQIDQKSYKENQELDLDHQSKLSERSVRMSKKSTLKQNTQQPSQSKISVANHIQSIQLSNDIKNGFNNNNDKAKNMKQKQPSILNYQLNDKSKIYDQQHSQIYGTYVLEKQQSNLIESRQQTSPVNIKQTQSVEHNLSFKDGSSKLQQKIINKLNVQEGTQKYQNKLISEQKQPEIKSSVIQQRSDIVNHFNNQNYHDEHQNDGLSYMNQISNLSDHKNQKKSTISKNHYQLQVENHQIDIEQQIPQRSRKQTEDHHIFQSANFQVQHQPVNRKRVETQANYKETQKKQNYERNLTQLKSYGQNSLRNEQNNNSVFQTQIYSSNVALANTKLAKIRQVKQFRKKKLEQQLAKVSEEINTLSKKESQIRQYASPAKHFNDRLKINNNVQARQKAICLVKNLQKQRKHRQIQKFEQIDKIDNKITDYMSQLTKIRSQNEKRMKEKRKLQIIERMKKKQMKKIGEMKKIEASSKFVSQFSRHQQMRPSQEDILSPPQSRDAASPFSRKRAGSKLEDYEEGLTPQLANKKAYLNKVRNLQQKVNKKESRHQEERNLYEQKLY